MQPDERRDERGQQPAERRAQDITSLADLADLIRNENAELKRDLGDRLRNVEDDYVHMAEAQQQLRERHDHLEDKQTTAAKQLRKHDSEIQIKMAMKTTTTTTDHMKDMERRIQGLEKNATNPSHASQESNGGNVVVIRGFARDTQNEATSRTSSRAC